MKRLLILFTLIVLTVEAFGKWIFALCLVALFGVAFAQASGPSLPAQLLPYEATVTLLIGLISTVFTHGLTALFKRFGNTHGPATVLVSAVLSVLLSGGFTVWQAVQSHHGSDIWQAALSAGMAFLLSNTAYLAQVAAASKGAVAAQPAAVQIIGATHVIYPNPAPGLEQAHAQDGTLIGYTKPLTPGQPTEVKTGLENLK
jgi:hypothetical protein